MKKITLLLIIIIFIQLIHVPCIAIQPSSSKHHTWYLGNKICFPQYSNITTYIDKLIKYNINDEIHHTPIGFGSFIGYQKNHQYFNFEFGYNWFGHITYTNEDISSSLKIQNVDISTKLQYPIINKNISIYTKLGGAVWHASIKNTYYNNMDIYHVHISDTSISPLLSFGLEYEFKKNWKSRLEYQKINNIGNLKTIGTQSNQNIINFNILYYFK